jgi:tetratricopeptide (TPR) repeat protein
MGDILVLAGEYQAAQDRYLVCRTILAGEAANLYLEERVTLERKIGTTFESLGNYEQALICLADAQRFLAESPATMVVENAQILNDIGWIHFQRGHFEDAEACLLEALKLTRDTPRHDVIASICNRLGGVYYQKNQLDQASLYTRKSLDFREEIGDVMGLARSYNNLGLLGWKRGDWDQAMEDFLRSLELNASLGDVEGLVVLHNNIGLLHTDKGNLEEARFHLEKNLEGALKIGHSYLEGQAYMHLGRLWLAAKEWQKSLEYSQLALAIVQNIESGENLANLYTDMGEAWFGLGDLDQAQQCGQMALQTLNERELDLESLSRKGRIFRLLGNINRNRSDLEKAAELLKESETLITQSGNQLELGRTLVAMASLAEARQESGESRKKLTTARQIFHKLGAALDLRELEQKP